MKAVSTGPARVEREPVQDVPRVGVEFLFISGTALDLVKKCVSSTGCSAEVVVLEALEAHLACIESRTTEQGSE